MLILGILILFAKLYMARKEMEACGWILSKTYANFMLLSLSSLNVSIDHHHY